jgi:hypothetical protein
MTAPKENRIIIKNLKVQSIIPLLVQLIYQSVLFIHINAVSSSLICASTAAPDRTNDTASLSVGIIDANVAATAGRMPLPEAAS